MNYKQGAYNGIGRHLLKLTDNGYLDRFKLPTGYPLQPYVYMLGQRGRKYFEEELNWDIPKLPTLATMKTRSHSFLMHVLEGNNVIIAAKQFATYNPNASLIRFEHEVLLKKNPLLAISLTGKKIAISPDALLEIEANGRRVLWIEVERGTNNEKYLLEKMHDIYDVFDRRVFQDRVGTNRCRVCFMTTAGYTDVERLRRLARTVLTERLGTAAPQSKRNLIFNFIDIPAMETGEIDVARTFLQSSWLHPFHLEHFPILEVKE